MEEYLAGYDDDDNDGPSALRFGHSASSRRGSSGSSSSNGSQSSRGSRGSRPAQRSPSPTSSSSRRSSWAQGVTTQSRPQHEEDITDDEGFDRIDETASHPGRVATPDSLSDESVGGEGVSAKVGHEAAEAELAEPQEDDGEELRDSGHDGVPMNGLEHDEIDKDRDDDDDDDDDDDRGISYDEGITEADDGDRQSHYPVDDVDTFASGPMQGSHAQDDRDHTHEPQIPHQSPITRPEPPLSTYKLDLHDHLKSTHSRPVSLAAAFARAGNTYLPPFYRPWTANDRSRLFISLARHSRFRPDLIGADIGRSEGEVSAYLEMLERGAAVVRRRRDRLDRVGLEREGGSHGEDDEDLHASEDDEEKIGRGRQGAQFTPGKKRKRPDPKTRSTATSGQGWRYWREGFTPGATTVPDDWIELEERFAAEIEKDVDAERARLWKEDRFRRWGQITVEVKAALERRRAQEQASAGTSAQLVNSYTAADVNAEVQRRIVREFGRSWDAGPEWGDVLDRDKLLVLRRRLMKSRMKGMDNMVDKRTTTARQGASEVNANEQQAEREHVNGDEDGPPPVKLERDTMGTSRPRPRRRLTDRHDELEARARRSMVERGRVERRARRNKVMGDVPLEVLHARGIAFLQRLSERRKAAGVSSNAVKNTRNDGLSSDDDDDGSNDMDVHDDTANGRERRAGNDNADSDIAAAGRHRQPVLGRTLRTIRRNMAVYLRKRDRPTLAAGAVAEADRSGLYQRWEDKGPSGREWVELQMEEMRDKARIARAVRVSAGDELDTGSDLQEDGDDEVDNFDADAALHDGHTGGTGDGGGTRRKQPAPSEAHHDELPGRLGRTWPHRRYEWTEYADDAAHDFIRAFPRALRSDAMQEVYKRLRGRIRRRREARMKSLVDDAGMEGHVVEAEGGPDVVCRTREGQGDSTEDVRSTDVAQMRDGGKGVSGEEWVEVLVKELGPVDVAGRTRPSKEAGAYETALREAVEGKEAVHSRLADLFNHRMPGWTLTDDAIDGGGKSDAREGKEEQKTLAKATKRRAKIEEAVRRDLEAAAEKRDLKRDLLVEVGGMELAEIDRLGGVGRCWTKRFGRVLGLERPRVRRSGDADDLDDLDDAERDSGEDDDGTDGIPVENIARGLVDLYIAAQRTPTGRRIDRDPAANDRPVNDRARADEASTSPTKSAQSTARRPRMGAPIPFSDSAKADQAAIVYLQRISRTLEEAGGPSTSGQIASSAASAQEDGQRRELSSEEKTVLRWLKQRESVRKREAKAKGSSRDDRGEGAGLWDDLTGPEWVSVLVALLHRAQNIGERGAAQDPPIHPGSSRTAIFFAQLFPYRPAGATKANDTRAAEWFGRQPRTRRTGLEWVVLKYLEDRMRSASKPTSTSTIKGSGSTGAQRDEEAEEMVPEQTGEEWAFSLLRELRGDTAMPSVEGINKRVKVYNDGELPSLEITEHLDDRAKAHILGINSRRRTSEHSAVLDLVDQRIRRRRKTRMTKLVNEGMAAGEVKQAGGADQVWRAKLAGADDGVAAGPAEADSAEAASGQRRNTRSSKANDRAGGGGKVKEQAMEKWRARRTRATSVRWIRVGGVELDIGEKGTGGQAWAEVLCGVLSTRSDGGLTEHSRGDKPQSARDDDDGGDGLGAIDDGIHENGSTDSDNEGSDHDAVSGPARDPVHAGISQSYSKVSRRQRHIYDDLAVAYLRTKPKQADGARSTTAPWTHDEAALLDQLVKAKEALQTSRFGLLRKRFGLSRDEVLQRGGVDRVWAELHPAPNDARGDARGPGEDAMTGRKWVEVLLREAAAKRRHGARDLRAGLGSHDEASGSGDDAMRSADAQGNDTGAGDYSQGRSSMTRWNRKYGRYAVEQLDERALDYLCSLSKADGKREDRSNDSNFNRRDRKRKAGTSGPDRRRTRAEEALLVRLKRRRDNRRCARRNQLIQAFGLTKAGIDRMGGADVVWRQKHPAATIQGGTEGMDASSDRRRGGVQDNPGTGVPDISGEEWVRMLLAEIPGGRQVAGDIDMDAEQLLEDGDVDTDEENDDDDEGATQHDSGSRPRSNGVTQSVSGLTTESIVIPNAKRGKTKLNRRTREILDAKAVEFVLAQPKQGRTTEQTFLVNHIQKGQRAGTAWRERVLLDRGWTSEGIRAAGGVTGAWWTRNDTGGKKRNGEEIDYEAVKSLTGKEWAEKRMKEIGIWSRHANGVVGEAFGAVETRNALKGAHGSDQVGAEPQSKREAMRLGMGADENGLNGWDVFDMGWFARRLGTEDNDLKTMSGEVLHHLRSELDRFLIPLVAGSIVVAEQRRAQLGIVSTSKQSAVADADGDHNTDTDESDDEGDHGVDGAIDVFENKPKRRKGAPADAEIDINHVRTALALQGRSRRDPTRGKWIEDEHDRRLRAYQSVREGERWNMDPPRWVGWEVMHLPDGSGKRIEDADGESGGDGSGWEIESTQTDREEEELDVARDKMDEALDRAEMDRLWAGGARSGDEVGDDDASLRPTKKRKTVQESAISRETLPAVRDYKRLYARIMRARQTRRDIAARRAKVQEKRDAKTRTMVRGRYRTRLWPLSTVVVDSDDEDGRAHGDAQGVDYDGHGDDDDDDDSNDEDMVRSERGDGLVDEEDGSGSDEIDDMVVDDGDAD